MEDKAKIYQNRVNKEFHNNMKIYTSYNEKVVGKDNKITNVSDIRKKINDIVKSDGFIYSKLVNIIVGDDVIKRKIIGIVGSSLVTIDNEYIPIENIKDIYVK